MHFDANQWITIIVAFIAAGGPTGTAVFALISSNKRMDDVGKRLDRIEPRLDKIDENIGQVKERLVRLEERAGIVLTR
jgi:hypothetical protein